MKADKIKITTRQNEYLLEMQEGPRTTQDLVRHIMVNYQSVGKVLKVLRDAGLVKTSPVKGAQGNVKQHELTAPYPELLKRITIVKTLHRNIVPFEEVLYVAILRNGQMTGQELVKQHRKIYPNRKKGGVSNIVDKAKSEGLCR